MKPVDIEYEIVAVEEDWNAERPCPRDHMRNRRVVARTADHQRVRLLNKAVVLGEIVQVKPCGRNVAIRICRQGQPRIEGAIAEGARVGILVKIGDAAASRAHLPNTSLIGCPPRIDVLEGLAQI